MLDTYLKWLTHHKPLLYAIIIAGVLVWGWHRWMGFREHQLQSDFDLKQHELQNAKDASSQAANLVAAASNRNQQTDLSAQRRIQELQAQINRLSQELAARKSSDASLDDLGLANRWATLTGVGTTDLQPNPEGGLKVSHAGAVTTVQKLEEVPALEDSVVAKQGIIDQQGGQIVAKDSLIASLQAQSAADKVTLAKQEAACNAKVKLEVKKEHDKRAKGGWLIRGVVFVAGVYLGHKL